MLKTFEALYDHGRIVPLNDVIDFDTARVLITVLEANVPVKGVSGEKLSEFIGTLKNFPEDPVEFQRRVRDEW